ncbi:VanZ family protein [Flammeovirgaceae bacterium SG7u.111]|nr:VanZ family protein [Flammeovirgaceae bacterium SG7u.132]WPO34029.1 VanZ family protein [Flammeovirgaceae bacterium SG7u.111]
MPIYLVVLVWFLFFYTGNRLIPNRNDYTLKRDVNAIPFVMIGHYIDKCTWEESGEDEYVEFAVNVFGNMLLFMPLGFLLPFMRWGSEKTGWVLLICCGLSLLIESLQISLSVGNFDIDDVILNTCGGYLGLLVYRLLYYKVA